MIIGHMLAWIVVATPSIPRLSLVVKLLDMSFKIGPLGMVPSNLGWFMHNLILILSVRRCYRLVVVMAGRNILGRFCDPLSNKHQIARLQTVIEAGN